VSRLADDMYLIIHDERSGRLKVPPWRAGMGLAAGLLGELILPGYATIYLDRVYPVAPVEQGRSASGAAGLEALVQQVLLAAIAGRRDVRPVREWLRFLSRDALDDVRARLYREGALTRSRHLSVSRGVRVEYPPVSAIRAAWPGIRLARRLTRDDVGVRAGAGEFLTEQQWLQDNLLAGLLEATDLLGRVLRDEPDQATGKARAAQLRHGLPADTQSLVAHLEAVLADGVLSYR
jgi:hypothetical protein